MRHSPVLCRQLGAAVAPLTRCPSPPIPLVPHAATYATSEVRFLRASEPRGEWTVVRPRQQGTRYIDVCHRGDHLFILVQ